MNKLEEFIKICKRYKIALAYLFGSQKDNTFKLLNNKKVRINDPMADIDIGIVFIKYEDNIKERYRLYASIYNDNDMEEIFKPYPLDLVFLQGCHSVFQLEALKGLCIYSVSEEFKDSYEMTILRKAADFRYVLDKLYEEALENY